MVFIDFEFSRTTHAKVNLVSCSLWNTEDNERYRFWLHNDPETQLELKQYLLKNKDKTFTGWATIAEARSFISLGLNPTQFKWIDMFLEYRCLTNHNDRLLYGRQLVEGKIKTFKKPPPKWERTEEDEAKSFQPTHSLAEATFKLCEEIRDTDHKNAMRDLIISDPLFFTPEQKKAILDYGDEDVLFLPRMFERILEEYREVKVKTDAQLEREMQLRGLYSALTAKMESRGYPISYKKTKNFAASVGPLLDECQREINDLFPDIKPFKYNKKEKRFSWDQKVTKEWIKNNVDISRWMLTDKYKDDSKLWRKEDFEARQNGQERPEPLDKSQYLSLSLEAWQRFFDFKHSYPKDNFGAQIVRYLKLKQNLAGFSPSKGKKTFWDSVGPDLRVRPYMNIYKAQSSRSQPSSTAFLFLKPAWMRSLCEPNPGRAVGGFDYGSVEFLIAALWAEDENMVATYKSGDVYLHYGKLRGTIPKDGTKAQYKRQRDDQKPIILGMQFLMSKYGLAVSLSQATGKTVTEDEAQEIIDEWGEIYSTLVEKQNKLKEDYYSKEIDYIKLECGWYMFGDNDNFRSVCNVPIQGLSASIMRKAVEYADAAGLDVIKTLHDAVYIEYDSFDFKAMDTLRKCMYDAFMFYFPKQERDASIIRLDGFSWSPDYEEGKVTTPAGLELDIGPLYIDDRATDEYEQFKKYFNDRIEDLL